MVGTYGVAAEAAVVTMAEVEEHEGTRESIPNAALNPRPD